MSTYSNIHPYAIASFSFKGESGELSFDEGDVIELIRYIDGEWVEGRKGGVNGLVPVSYIQIIIYPDEGGNGHCELIQTESIGIAHVLFDFNGAAKDELNVESGSQIKVISYVNEEWIRCYDPMSDSVGIIPVSFVQIYAEDEGEDATWSSPITPFPNNSITCPSQHSKSHDVWNSGWDDEISSLEKQKQPPRPPEPSKEAMEIYIKNKKISEKGGSIDVSPNGSDDGGGKALIILNEFVSSENTYFFDIMSFVSAVNDSKMAKEDTEVLCGMMGPLIQLSMSLHESLSIQKIMGDASKLSVGKMFLEYRKSFSQVYSFYFRQLEAAYKIVERPDNEEVMMEIKNSMKDALPDTSCIEMTSTLMRPIQRCLKYPLLLTQLVKALPIIHNDHPKLLEAVKQMSNLASKMNESRRRRELVNKYSTESKKSIGDRISTINLHSLQKKSSRLTTRLGNSIGLIDLPKDATMDCLLSKLYKLERIQVHFIYYLTVHMKKVQNILTNERCLKEICPSINYVALTKKTTLLAQNWIMNTNFNVRFVIERTMREIPKKLIQKRDDKLLDYYNALKKSSSDMIDRKREYEALSVQLRQKLPSVINSITKSLRQAWIVLKDLHITCERALCDSMKEETGIKGDMKTPISRGSLEKIRAITATAFKEFLQMEEEFIKLKGDIVVKQTPEDRMNVWSKMSTKAFKSSSGVFRLDQEWPGVRPPKDDLVCSIGDLLYVEQPYKNNDLWECWNGKTKGLVDATVLSPVSINEMGRPQSTPLPPTHSHSASIGHNPSISNATNLNLLDLDCPIECSIPVLQASSLDKRVPSLPSISTCDPFDEFLSLRISVSRAAASPSSSIPIPISTISSSHPSSQTISHNPVSSMPTISHYSSFTDSLSTNILQPTRISSTPVQVDAQSTQFVKLSSTNPFRDIYDAHP